MQIWCALVVFSALHYSVDSANVQTLKTTQHGLTGQKSKSGGTSNKLHLDCVADEFPQSRLDYFVRTDPHNTASLCIKTCRQQHFGYSTLMHGVDCYCGGNEIRGHTADDEPARKKVLPECSLTCPGDPTESCGGAESSDLYMVPEDRRYLGCYKDNPNDRDMIFQWSPNPDRSVHDCLLNCRTQFYQFGAVQNGGACYCGNSYGKHGEENEEFCDTPCIAGYKRQNCGGFEANAVYMTERGRDFSQELDPYIRRLYDGARQRTEIQMSLFDTYSKLTSVVTDKIALSISDAVVNINQTDCISNCYEPCGDVFHPEGFEYKGEELIVRTFHLNLQDLGDYLGADTKQVIVYAQTVVMNANLVVDYSLVIHARELILDPSQGALSIQATAEAPSIGIADMTQALEKDFVNIKQTVQCARILMETKQLADHAKAFAMVDDITRLESTDEEIQIYVQQVRSFLSEMAGSMRSGINYVPFYTKSHMSKVLKTYGTQISIYKEEFDRVQDRDLAFENFVDAAEGMLGIYADTDIEEAKAGLDAAMIAVERSNATYRALYDRYEEANATMEEARVRFEQALQDKIDEALENAVFSYFNLIFKVIEGVIVSYFDPSQTEEKMKEAGVAFKDFVQSMVELSKIMNAVKSLLRVIDDIMAKIADIDFDGDFENFHDDIETVVALATSVVEWEAFKSNADTLMNDARLKDLDGAPEYRQSMLELGNWGKAVSESCVEVAEALRVAMEKRLILNARIKKKERLDELIEDLREELIGREIMAYALMEQTYDVRADLNDALITFCQAYFFENVNPCKEVYKPRFGGSLRDLLLKINAARKDALLIAQVPSTVSRKIHLVNSDNDPACEDVSACPVTYFKKHRMLSYQLPLNHVDIFDLEKYMVADIELQFEGVQVNRDSRGNTLLKLIIENTGEFMNRVEGSVYSFVGKPLYLLYEYDTIEGTVTIRGDVYPPFRDIVSHVTPFTTWIIRVSEDRSENIDVSNISGITMILHGSAVNGEM